MTKEECEVETSKAIMEMRNHIEELEKEISILLSCKNCPDNKGGLLCQKEYEDKCLAQKIQYIKELKEENAELKERADKSDLDSVTFFNQLCKAKEIIKDLSKSLFLAKGIVRDLIDDTVDFKESKERAIYCYEREKFDIYKQAEQFLRESE